MVQIKPLIMLPSLNVHTVISYTSFYLPGEIIKSLCYDTPYAQEHVMVLCRV